jgi:hypothetical protein
VTQHTSNSPDPFSNGSRKFGTGYGHVSVRSRKISCAYQLREEKKAPRTQQQCALSSQPAQRPLQQKLNGLHPRERPYLILRNDINLPQIETVRAGTRSRKNEQKYAESWLIGQRDPPINDSRSTSRYPIELLETYRVLDPFPFHCPPRPFNPHKIRSIFCFKRENEKIILFYYSSTKCVLYNFLSRNEEFFFFLLAFFVFLFTFFVSYEVFLLCFDLSSRTISLNLFQQFELCGPLPHHTRVSHESECIILVDECELGDEPSLQAKSSSGQ